MDMDLSGKRALITGSTRGIGLAVAKGLARMGAEVIVNGRTDDGVERAMDAVLQVAPTAAIHGMAANISDAEGCDAVIFAFPKIDILVNNFGIHGSRDFFEIPDADWQHLFDANVMSGVRLTRYYLKDMLTYNDWGRVVFVSGESAVVVPPEMVHYGMTKSAQLVIARGAAETTKGTNITVNSVLPGPTGVEARREGLAARAAEQGTTVEDPKRRAFTERRPTSLLQRHASTEEIANLICYVCSKASSATNGATLRADGGIITNPF
jgi:NAD(P)-dependent dehydrogenase (short-subunit alcohol dehydrogenase family)